VTRRQALWVVFIALALAGCSVPIHALASWQPGWGPYLALVAALTVASALRVAWLLTTAGRAVSALKLGEPSCELRLAARRAGVDRVVVVDSEDVYALCSGLLRPRVVVSVGLASAATPAVLEAVLVHEAHHAKRREPLRRAIFSAVADVLLPLPVVRWWADRHVEESELAADRAAIQRVGVKSVAAALMIFGSSARRSAVAAFGGAAELRAAQVLGEPLPKRRVPLRTLAGSAAGLTGLASAVLCATLVSG